MITETRYLVGSQPSAHLSLWQAVADREINAGEIARTGSQKESDVLNKVKGNMFDWVTHTWNTVKGECPHGCEYCYMKRFGKQKPVRIDSKEFKTDLGTGNVIFVGSSCDMWADSIPDLWIDWTLIHCRKFDNQYFFQSKNPKRINANRLKLPAGSVVATTIESHVRLGSMGNTPSVQKRVEQLYALHEAGFKTVVTVEPIMDFIPHLFAELILTAHPAWVNIGANTNHKVRLTEPSSEKVGELISLLSEKTEVRLKPNLGRIYKA